MNIEATKLELMHLLLQTQKESLLTKVKKVFDEEQTDWWDDMDPEEKQEVETGLSEADKGKLTPHKKVMKRFDKWR
jgi:predicted transcriptional regulator